MLSINGNEPTPSGNWAWISAVIAGVFSILTAVVHRLTRRPPHIPTQNAAEIFERLSYIESKQANTDDGHNRTWVSIEDIRRDISEIRREMVSREELERSLFDLKRDLKKELSRILDSTT
jgi:hypothetical protein